MNRFFGFGKDPRSDQTLDSDLTAIAGLSPTNDDIIQRKSGAWVNRTLAQLITDITVAIQDIVGGMVSGNTETGIDVGYSGAKLNFELDLSYLDANLIPVDGWQEQTDTWTYASADDPVFQVYVFGNITASEHYKVGRIIKCTNNSTTFYGFIVKIGAYDSGNNRTPMDIYGGTDYDLANSAITNTAISRVKQPDGFPLDPSKWTVKVTDTSDRTQASPIRFSQGHRAPQPRPPIWQVRYPLRTTQRATPK